MGIGENTAIVQDDDEHDDEAVPIHHEENISAKNRLLSLLFAVARELFFLKIKDLTFFIGDASFLSAGMFLQGPLYL